MQRTLVPLALFGVTFLSACATVPTGPSLMSLPGSGKSFNEFLVDDADCREFAFYQAGGTTANETATQSAVASAVVGTAVGAGAGALISGQQGAAVGAGAGLLVGSLAGTGAAHASAYELQRRYDNAYLQCMYAKGNRIPVWGRITERAPQGSVSRYSVRNPPPPPDYPPPPPPGRPPPPPPDVEVR